LKIYFRLLYFVTVADNPSHAAMLEAERVVKHLITRVDLGIEQVQMQDLRLAIVQNFDPKSAALFGKKILFTVTQNLMIFGKCGFLCFKINLNR